MMNPKIWLTASGSTVLENMLRGSTSGITEKKNAGAICKRHSYENLNYLKSEWEKLYDNLHW